MLSNLSKLYIKLFLSNHFPKGIVISKNKINIYLFLKIFIYKDLTRKLDNIQAVITNILWPPSLSCAEHAVLRGGHGFSSMAKN